MKIAAVIFDMDGVIVNSEPFHELAYLEVVRELGYGETHGLKFSDYVGLSDLDLWTAFVAKHRPPQGLPELMGMKHEHMVRILREHQPLFEGLPELVEKLAQRFRLGLASGSEHVVIDEVLAMRGLRRHFSAVVSASEVKRGKPAPDIFLRTAQLLGVDPQACWVIEDSKPGVAAALAAGMQVIAVTNTHPAEELPRATRVTGSYAQIEQWLLAT